MFGFSGSVQCGLTVLIYVAEIDRRQTEGSAILFAPPMSSAQEVSDGKLTVEGFSVAARAFSNKWKTYNQSFPPWLWVPLINRTLLVSNKVHNDQHHSP